MSLLGKNIDQLKNGLANQSVVVGLFRQKASEVEFLFRKFVEGHAQTLDENAYVPIYGLRAPI